MDDRCNCRMARPLRTQPDHPQNEERIPSMIPQLMQHPLLVRSEEIDLARRARAGDDTARRKLAESNLRLVCNIAKKYSTPGISFEDLVQEGTIGLMRAIDRYDPEMGWKFSTYAVFWIKQAIGKAMLQRSRVIRLPAHILEAGRKVSRRRNDLAAVLGRPPTEEELSVDLGMTLERLKAINGADHDCLSLDSGKDDAWDYTALLQDHQCDDPEGAALQSIAKDEVYKLVRRLPERERTVLARRLGVGGEMPNHVLEELAAKLDVSRERIRQIEAKALRCLRRMVAEEERPAIEALLDGRP